MDPNETYRRINELRSRARYRTPTKSERAERAECVIALREWIARGGFLPDGCRRTR